MGCMIPFFVCVTPNDIPQSLELCTKKTRQNVIPRGENLPWTNLFIFLQKYQIRIAAIFRLQNICII